MYGTKLADVQREEEAREAQMSKMKLELERNERRQKKTIVKKEIATSENKENKLSPMLLPKEEVAEMQPIDGWDDAAEIPELSEEEDPKTVSKFFNFEIIIFRLEESVIRGMLQLVMAGLTPYWIWA